MREYRFYAPATMEELFRIAAQPETEVKFLAGGTDLVPKINMERDQIPYEDKPPMAIVSLQKLGLDGIVDQGDAITIGATTRIADIQDSTLLRDRAPALCQACDQLASFAIRNEATLGGNIVNASPAADTLPALYVLEAQVILQSARGQRSVKITDFMVGPGKAAIEKDEVLTSVVLYPGAGKSSFQKLGRRAAETLSVINAAAYIEMHNGICTKARVAVGSAAPTTKLCQAAAAALEGAPITEAAVCTAMEKVNDVLSPIDDIRASAWYRRETAPVMAARAVLAAAENI